MEARYADRASRGKRRADWLSDAQRAHHQASLSASKTIRIKTLGDQSAATLHESAIDPQSAPTAAEGNARRSRLSRRSSCTTSRISHRGFRSPCKTCPSALRQARVSQGFARDDGEERRQDRHDDIAAFVHLERAGAPPDGLRPQRARRFQTLQNLNGTMKLRAHRRASYDDEARPFEQGSKRY